MSADLAAMYLGELLAGAAMTAVFYYVSLLLIKRKNKLYNIITGAIIALFFFGLYNKNLSITIGIGIIIAGFVIYISNARKRLRGNGSKESQ